MTRRIFTEILSDGKRYTFTERNKEDIDFGHLQEVVREATFLRIADYEKRLFITKEMADDLRYVNFQKIYNDMEISSHIASHPEELFKLVYASFKINNEKITLDEFKQLVDLKLANKLLKDINELEKGDPLSDKDCAEELGMNKQKFVDMAKNHPEIYNYLKYNVKKNPVQKLAKK